MTTYEHRSPGTSIGVHYEKQNPDRFVRTRDDLPGEISQVG